MASARVQNRGVFTVKSVNHRALTLDRQSLPPRGAAAPRSGGPRTWSGRPGASRRLGMTSRGPGASYGTSRAHPRLVVAASRRGALAGSRRPRDPGLARMAGRRGRTRELPDHRQLLHRHVARVYQHVDRDAVDGLLRAAPVAQPSSRRGGREVAGAPDARAPSPHRADAIVNAASSTRSSDRRPPHALGAVGRGPRRARTPPPCRRAAPRRHSCRSASASMPSCRTSWGGGRDRNRRGRPARR